MNFDEIHATIPFVKEGKKHSVITKLYPGVVAKQPGVHADVTKGGDAVIVVTDKDIGWKGHQFKHDDIFVDVEEKVFAEPETTRFLMECYRDIILGTNKFSAAYWTWPKELPGLNATLFLQAVQALAVIEHRRYAVHEANFGGRFLPFRFATGIAEKRWSAGNAIMLQKRGRPGVEQLEAKYGVPYLTETLMNV